MIADAVRHHAPHINVVPFHDEAVGKFSVRRAQRRAAASKSRVLEQRLLFTAPMMTCPAVPSIALSTIIESPQEIHAPPICGRPYSPIT